MSPTMTPYLFLALFVYGTRGQLIGCPLLGCLPTGTFALGGPLPSTQVKLAWTVIVSNVSLPVSTQLGCATNQGYIVCPTDRGFVSLKSDTGSVVWQTRPLLRNPPLPLLDVYGELIACDGRYLIKFDSDGSIVNQPINLTYNVSPVFSLNIGDNDLFLITSKGGFLISYNTAGIPFASLILRATVDGLNGSFLPVSPPAISGHRAYLLTEFKIDAGVQLPRDKEHAPSPLRLYAVDMVHRMVRILDPRWYIDLPNTVVASHDPVVMSTGSIVLVSTANATLWLLEDAGDNGRVRSRLSLPTAHLAASQPFPTPVWAAAQGADVIICLNPATSDVILQTTVGAVLGRPGTVTSRLMAARTPCGSEICDLLVMGVKLTGTGSALLVALAADSARTRLGVLWSVGAPGDGEIVGQIAVSTTTAGQPLLVAMTSQGERTSVFAVTDTAAFHVEPAFEK